MDGKIIPMTKRHAKAAARLHRQGIDTGFLSSLGPMFLRQLYAAIPSCPSGFGFVMEDASGKVQGFVACGESPGKVYKQCLLRRGPMMAFPLIRFLFRPSVIKRIIQTLRYPAEVGEELPPAEVLSIAVSPDARGKGVGKALISAALEEFARRGADKVKVAVWAGNKGAIRFYEQCGFSLAAQRRHHGLPMNIYVAELKERSGLAPADQAAAV